MEEAVAGVTNVLLCLQTSDVVSEINRNQTVKAVMPDRTGAYVVCPRTSKLPQTKGMVHLTCLKLVELCTSPIDLAHDIKYQVLYDPRRAQAGQISQDELTLPMQTVCNHKSPSSSAVLWDSGASKSFISKEFVKLHNLATV